VSRTAEELLEFGKLREIVARYSTCAPGRRAIERLGPRTDASALDAEFELIREAIAYLRSGSELGFGALADPAGWLARLTVPASSLTAAEILDAASLMDVVSSLKQTLRGESAKYPHLAERAGALADYRSLATAIRRAILPNGELNDDASPTLKRIRAGMAQAREKIQQSLEKILRARGEESREDYITLRNDRFVIPLRATERRSVPGVVHGASATGQTLFVEPLETIVLNNRLVQLAEDEAAEIARILAEFTERIRAERGPLEFAAATIADLDSLFARGRFARDFDATIPQFTAGNRLRLNASRNPVLEDNLRRKERKVVPISLELGGGETIMVISGPNTGGKTVALKTVGLAALAGNRASSKRQEPSERRVYHDALHRSCWQRCLRLPRPNWMTPRTRLRPIPPRSRPRRLCPLDHAG